METKKEIKPIGSLETTINLTIPLVIVNDYHPKYKGAIHNGEIVEHELSLKDIVELEGKTIGFSVEKDSLYYKVMSFFYGDNVPEIIKEGVGYFEEGIKINLSSSLETETYSVIAKYDGRDTMGFGEAMKAVGDGKKVRMIEWGENIVYIKMIRTYEKGDDICNQRFIASFYKNGTLMPHPYTPTQYDIIAGEFEIVE